MLHMVTWSVALIDLQLQTGDRHEPEKPYPRDVCLPNLGPFL